MRTLDAIRSVALALLAGGCGGGAPLLHPAHPLAPDNVSLGAGVSHNVVMGEAESQLEKAKLEANSSTSTPGRQDRVLTGALAETMTGPGLAPWVGARAGIGYDSDAGLTYTGRGARVDARHAFVDGALALSVGLGIHRRFERTGGEGEEGSGTVPGVDTSDVSGAGGDLPVIVGYRSQGGLIAVYGGVRGHFEYMTGKVVLPDFNVAGATRIGDLEATKVGGSGLAGLMIGVEPVWVALEASVGLFHGSGNVTTPPDANGPNSRTNGSFTAPIVSPAGALITRF
ncbi:MAG: hypothetical protein R3B13_38450 [Polyangiaceae bacterium]